jgi:hypothetical protein
MCKPKKLTCSYGILEHWSFLFTNICAIFSLLNHLFYMLSLFILLPFSNMAHFQIWLAIIKHVISVIDSGKPKIRHMVPPSCTKWRITAMADISGGFLAFRHGQFCDGWHLNA